MKSDLYIYFEDSFLNHQNQKLIKKRIENVVLSRMKCAVFFDRVSNFNNISKDKVKEKHFVIGEDVHHLFDFYYFFTHSKEGDCAAFLREELCVEDTELYFPKDNTYENVIDDEKFRDGLIKTSLKRVRPKDLSFSSFKLIPLVIFNKDTPLSSALFLDRDGIINVDDGYVYEIDKVKIYPQIAEIIFLAKESGMKCFVLTNQSGVGRGYYSESHVIDVNNHISSSLLKMGVEIDDWYYCPYHPQGTVEKYSYNSYFRKPNPGMLIKAASEHNIDLSTSYMIGDKDSDAFELLEMRCLLLKGNYDIKSKNSYVAKNHEDLIDLFQRLI